ncbi:MAG: hypothetical protein JOZ05_06535 [Acetobacteraceae bacterium]|nr:hypothetical protein [Acetobacteraceae bacterium]
MKPQIGVAMAEVVRSDPPGRAEPEGMAARRGPVGSAFDVVALVSSAGGLPALNQVLLQLPDDSARLW